MKMSTNPKKHFAKPKISCEIIDSKTRWQNSDSPQRKPRTDTESVDMQQVKKRGHTKVLFG